MTMTQNEKIRMYMRDHGSITPMDAMREFGIMRLASRISEMRKDGESITKTTVKDKNRYGDTVHYAKYSYSEV